MAALTDAEAAVYDRQIRVWGVETQKRCSAHALRILKGSRDPAALSTCERSDGRESPLCAG